MLTSPESPKGLVYLLRRSGNGMSRRKKGYVGPLRGRRAERRPGPQRHGNDDQNGERNPRERRDHPAQPVQYPAHFSQPTPANSRRF